MISSRLFSTVMKRIFLTGAKPGLAGVLYYLAIGEIYWLGINQVRGEFVLAASKARTMLIFAHAMVTELCSSQHDYDKNAHKPSEISTADDAL